MSDVQFTHYQDQNVFVVTIVGDLTSPNSAEFNKYLKPILEAMDKSAGLNGLVFNLEAVSMLDSSGIGIICGKFIRLKKQNKKLALCNAGRRVVDVFEMSGLGKTLPFYDTLALALIPLMPMTLKPVKQIKTESVFLRLGISKIKVSRKRITIRLR